MEVTQMRKQVFIALFLLSFILGPIFFAWLQDVPTQSTYQLVVLLASLGAFGALLGQFLLSRLLPRDVTTMKLSSMLRWHKYIGYTAGTVMLLHPFLLVARRIWVEETDAFGNFLLMLKSSTLLPAIIAMITLVLIVFLALIRRSLRGKTWRFVHGGLSMLFAATATWHVVTVGRHSNSAMSAFWIVLTVAVIAALLRSYAPAGGKPKAGIAKGVAHETAQ